MKRILTILCFACLTGSFFSLSAQEPANSSPFYNYSEDQLSNTATIPGFETQANKLNNMCVWIPSVSDEGGGKVSIHA